MTWLVQLGSIKIGGQGDSHTISQLLLVAQTNLTRDKNYFESVVSSDLYLAVGVNLGSHCSVLVQSILASNSKVRSSSQSTGAGDASLQAGAVLEVDAAAKHLQKLGL